MMLTKILSCAAILALGSLLSCSLASYGESVTVATAYYDALVAKDPRRMCSLFSSAFRKSFVSGPCEPIAAGIIGLRSNITSRTLVRVSSQKSPSSGRTRTVLRYNLVSNNRSIVEELVIDGVEASPSSFAIEAINELTFEPVD